MTDGTFNCDAVLNNGSALLGLVARPELLFRFQEADHATHTRPAFDIPFVHVLIGHALGLVAVVRLDAVLPRFPKYINPPVVEKRPILRHMREMRALPDIGEPGSALLLH